jgi:hypothetical protein
MLALLATYAMASVCLGLDGACTRAREMGGHSNPLAVFLPSKPSIGLVIVMCSHDASIEYYGCLFTHG